MLVFWIILVLALVYALPGLIAAARRHPRQRQIWLLDIGLGFTIFGWVMAFGQALKMPQETRRVRYSYAEDGLDRRPRRSLSELPINSDLFLAIGCIAILALVLSLAWQRVAPAILSQFGITQASAASHGWTYAANTVQSGRVARLESDPNSPMPATLTIQNSGQDVAVAVSISGQFNCSAAANGTVVVQFDQQQTQFVHCTVRPADAKDVGQAGQDSLYLADAPTFVAGLAAAQRVTLQAEVAGQGVKTLTFNPQGLDLASLNASDGQAAVVPAAIQQAGGQQTAAPAVKIAQGETAPILPAPVKTVATAPVIKTVAVKVNHPHKEYVVRKPEAEPSHYHSWHE